MKSIKFLIAIVAVACTLSSCYKDKGSYATKEWTCIESVALNVDVDGDYTMSLLEGEQLTATPEVVFKAGVDESDVEYNWVLGGDTIASTKDLDWTIVRTADMVFTSDGLANFWLDIRNTKTSENWRHFVANMDGYQRQVTIIPTRDPKIGVFVYSKDNGTIEWGSIKGSDNKTPEKFTTLFTDMYGFYNPDRTIEGNYVGGTFSSDLYIYTDKGPDYGAAIQIYVGKESLYPLGSYTGNIAGEVFAGATTVDIKDANYYPQVMQELLIGDKLYVSEASKSSYQIVLPGSSATQDGVAEVMGAKPFFQTMFFSVQRTTDNELFYYTYASGLGYNRIALVEADGATVEADKIIGVFRQPSFTEDKAVKIFVVAENAGAYNLYAYKVERTANAADKLTFVSKTDVSDWAGGINENTIWTTNVAEVSYNGLYIANGYSIYRTSYESLEEPELVTSFTHPIISMDVIPVGSNVNNAEAELYAAVFTYDGEQSYINILDFTTEELDDMTFIDDVIPGRVVEYIPSLQ